jgi:hypothetical protein
VISRSSEYFNSLAATDIQNLQAAIDGNYARIGHMDSVEVYRRRTGASSLPEQQ